MHRGAKHLFVGAAIEIQDQVPKQRALLPDKAIVILASALGMTAGSWNPSMI